MKNTNAVWYVVMALTAWCLWNSISTNNLVSEITAVDDKTSIIIRETAYMTDRLYALENAEPEVIVKEVVKEVPVEVIKEVEIIKEVMVRDTSDTTSGQ